MASLYKRLSWFFFLLTPVLATVAALAVPGNVFADYPDCSDYCKVACADSSYPAGCEIYCDAGCYSNCAECGGYTGDQYAWCELGCNAQTGTCNTTNKNDTSCNKVCREPTGSPGTCTVSGAGGCDIAGASCTACRCGYQMKYSECLCW